MGNIDYTKFKANGVGESYPPEVNKTLLEAKEAERVGDKEAATQKYAEFERLKSEYLETLNNGIIPINDNKE